jgi:tetratricopeptide (TPR) repeat protein
MAARRAAIFDQYAQWAADAYNEERWNDAIKYASSALSIFDNGQQYFIRGYAYESLGILKDARKDYKQCRFIVNDDGLFWQHDYNVSQSVWGDTGIIDFLNRLLWQPQNAAAK